MWVTPSQNSLIKQSELINYLSATIQMNLFNEKGNHFHKAKAGSYKLLSDTVQNDHIWY